jgi:hypothetical protein
MRTKSSHLTISNGITVKDNPVGEPEQSMSCTFPQPANVVPKDVSPRPLKITGLSAKTIEKIRETILLAHQYGLKKRRSACILCRLMMAAAFSA